ncbi:MAG: methyltransferase domain-containing protein [Verrucomicrobiales bacterium]
MNTAFTCLSCASPHGELALDLGVQPLANNLLRTEDLDKPEPKFPLEVAVCKECWLMQILTIAPPADLFSEYLYFSSFSDALLRHAKSAAELYISDQKLNGQSLVVEIASNDGYLLKNFKAAGVPCIGIEPAANIAKVARENGIESIVEFFGLELAQRLVGDGRQADLILGNNVFAHAPDTNSFVAGLKALCKPSGQIILEFPYGADLVEQTEFDTIYHEHVFYFTMLPLVPLFERHGLSIFRVERIPIHGGSLRLFVCHSGAKPIQESVHELLKEEKTKGMNSIGYYRDFARHVNQLKSDLTELLGELKQQGKSIAAYGASAKGSTLLNYFGLGKETIDFVADRSTHKQGRLTPGTHIPIVPPGEMEKRRPDYTLLLTWNFAEEILTQQAAYREKGGKFIVPIPQVKVV